jgi:hypothetical protein
MVEPVVRIGLKEVYDKLCVVEDKVILMTPQGEKITDHESRLRSLERWKYTIPASLLTAAAAILTTLLRH